MNRKKVEEVLDKKVKLSEIIKMLSVAFHASNIAEIIEKVETRETLIQKLEAVEKLSFVNIAVVILKSYGLNKKDAEDVFVNFTEFAKEELKSSINKREGK